MEAGGLGENMSEVGTEERTGYNMSMKVFKPQGSLNVGMSGMQWPFCQKSLSIPEYISRADEFSFCFSLYVHPLPETMSEGYVFLNIWPSIF